MIPARQALLVAALAATLAATWWVREREQEGEDVQAVRGRERATPRQAATDAPPREKGQTSHPGQHRFAVQGPDLFPAQSWQPPPPPPPKPPPPPPPVAPPLPFQYAGRWTEAGSEVFFLTHGAQLYTLRKGDMAAQWRLDEVAPGQLTFIYLPLNQRQIMRLTQ